MWSDNWINILCIQKNHNINNIYMKESRKNIFHWNHISNKLTEEQIEELKAYYQSYHKKCFTYKQALKNF